MASGRPGGELRARIERLMWGDLVQFDATARAEGLPMEVMPPEAQGHHRTAAYNERGLFDWERAAIDARFLGCRSLIVAGAGGRREVIGVAGAGGRREVIGLRRVGFEVEAFECHAELVRFANALLQRHAIGTKVRLAPRDECPHYGRCFDGALIGWGSYMLIRGRSCRVRVLRRLRAQLAPGAPVLVSFYALQAGHRRFRLTARMGNALGWLLRGERVEVGDYLAPNFVHFITRREIASELCASGFNLADFRAEPYGHPVALAT